MEIATKGILNSKGLVDKICSYLPHSDIHYSIKRFAGKIICVKVTNYQTILERLLLNLSNSGNTPLADLVSIGYHGVFSASDYLAENYKEMWPGILRDVMTDRFHISTKIPQVVKWDHDTFLNVTLLFKNSPWREWIFRILRIHTRIASRALFREMGAINRRLRRAGMVHSDVFFRKWGGVQGGNNEFVDYLINRVPLFRNQDIAANQTDVVDGVTRNSYITLCESGWNSNIQNAISFKKLLKRALNNMDVMIQKIYHLEESVVIPFTEMRVTV
jgi:hypothetical protein